MCGTFRTRLQVQQPSTELSTISKRVPNELDMQHKSYAAQAKSVYAHKTSQPNVYDARQALDTSFWHMFCRIHLQGHKQTVYTYADIEKEREM